MPDQGRGYLVSLARSISLQARERVWGNACIQFVHTLYGLPNDVRKCHITFLKLLGWDLHCSLTRDRLIHIKKLAACATVHVLIVVHNQNLTIWLVHDFSWSWKKAKYKHFPWLFPSLAVGWVWLARLEVTEVLNLALQNTSKVCSDSRSNGAIYECLEMAVAHWYDEWHHITQSHILVKSDQLYCIFTFFHLLKPLYNSRKKTFHSASSLESQNQTSWHLPSCTESNIYDLPSMLEWKLCFTC